MWPIFFWTKKTEQKDISNIPNEEETAMGVENPFKKTKTIEENKQKVVLEDSDNMEYWSEMKPVLQKYAFLLGVDIYASNPHGHSSTVETEEGKLYIRFWSYCKNGKMRKQSEEKRFGIYTDGGQEDCFSGEPTGLPIFDDNGILAADVVGGTMFVLFDLPHGNNAEVFLEKIMERFPKDSKDAEALESRLAEWKKTQEERQKKEYVTYRNQHIEVQKDTLRNEVRQGENTIKDCQQKIVKAVRAMRDANEHLKLLSNVENLESSYVEEWEKLNHMPGVEQVTFDAEESVISVFLSEPIHIAHNEKVYDIGKFRIDIDSDNGNVTAHNLTRQLGDTYDHPHVSDGDCCFGDISDGIAQLLGNYEYMALVTVMIRYLNSYNDDNPYANIENFPILGESEKEEEKQ